MVERYRRKKQSGRQRKSQQKNWIWGRHLVRETLAAGRWPMLELTLSDELPESELSSIQQSARESQVPLSVVSSDRVTQLSHSSEHQGYLARMSPFPYQTPEQLVDGVSSAATFLLLDGIQDPFNFGAIVRSAEVLGMAGIFVGSERQSPVNSQVARSSAGAVNHLPIAQAGDLVEWGRRLKSEYRYALIGTHQDGAIDVQCCDLTLPTVLIIGNEGTGIRAELLNLCDQLVRIPQHGQVPSLNAAVAAGILCYEVQRQRMRTAGK